MQVTLQVTWALIDPTRTPSVAAARDGFEKAKNQYLIGLRDLRLQAAEAFFTLQVADETVRIGQQSVRSSLVSLRDAKARFQAGVATKLEVLEAETQLARDQQVLTQGLADQAIARRDLASLLDLPQTVTPTSKEPSRVVGTWLPSLQESIVAAYAFREELDNILLDISIANSNANQALGEVQPFLNIAYNLVGGRARGFLSSTRTDPGFSYDNETWSVDNTMGPRTSAGTSSMAAAPGPCIARTSNWPSSRPSSSQISAIPSAGMWREASTNSRGTIATSLPPPVR